MPTARQFAAICVLWAVASGGATCTRLWEGGTPLLEAAFSEWAFKSAFVGAVVAAFVTPLVVIGSRAPRTWGLLALRVVHGALIGVPLGMAITWGILYAWPPEAMSHRGECAESLTQVSHERGHHLERHLRVGVVGKRHHR